MTADGCEEPVITAIGDSAVRISFGDRIDDHIFARVRAFDDAWSASPAAGTTFVVPAYASVTIGFDPLSTDHASVIAAAKALLNDPGASRQPARAAAREFMVPICYAPEFAPDLDAVAAAKGLSRDAVIAAHLSGSYRVYMYGFAPGYAYLGGVPAEIQIPRKPAPVRGVPSGRVIIAGPQCIIQTQTMPTGWWVIGQSPFRVFNPGAADPFAFAVGDTIRFRRIEREELAALEAAT